MTKSLTVVSSVAEPEYGVEVAVVVAVQVLPVAAPEGIVIFTAMSSLPPKAESVTVAGGICVTLSDLYIVAVQPVQEPDVKDVGKVIPRLVSVLFRTVWS